MDKVYALIKDGIVVNTIVAEPEFIHIIESQWDACIRIDNIATPDKWTKNGEQDQYSLPISTQQYWSKDGEQDVYEDPIDESWTYHFPTPDLTWTLVPGIQQPSIGWLYNDGNFSQ